MGMSLMNRQTYNVLLACHPGILDSNQVYHSSNNISSKAVPPHQLLPSFLFLLKISHPLPTPPTTSLHLNIRSPSPLHTLHSYHSLPRSILPQTHYPTPPPPPKTTANIPSPRFSNSHPLLACSQKKNLLARIWNTRF